MKSSSAPCGIKEMLAIALPMVVSGSCDTIMIFTDRLFLAKLSPEYMNASMGGGLTSFMLISFFGGLIGYSTALVAQYLGAGQKHRSSGVLAQALIIAVCAYPIMLLCKPIAYAMFSSMGVLEPQLSAQKLYFDLVLYGSIFGLVRGAFAGFFSGLGKTAVVMGASALCCVVNVALNWLWVFGNGGFPKMGITGAAAATIVSGCVGMIVMAVVYARTAKAEGYTPFSAFRFDREIFTKLIRYGSASGIELLLNIVAFNLMVMMFHAHSLVTATAATIMFNWDLVSFLPLIGIEIGVTSLVGRSMGEGRPDRAQVAVRSGTIIGVVYSLFIFVLFVFFTGPIVEIFRPTGDAGTFLAAVPIAEFMTRVAALYVTVEVFYFVLIGALRGAGDTWWAMGMTVTLHWLTVTAIWFVFHVLRGTPQTAWTTIVVMFVIFSYVVWLRYKNGAWKSLRVVDREPVVLVNDAFHETTDI